MISFIVPVYMSQDSLEELYTRIESVCSINSWVFEVVFVEDSGRDDSWVVIKALSQKHSHIRGYCLRRNYGQHNALLCGIRNAQGDLIVTLDDDLQNPPEEVPRLLDKLESGYDVVYGKPKRVQHNLFRDLSSQFTKIVLQKSMGVENAKNVSSFRIFRTNLRDAFTEFHGPSVNIDVLLTYGTKNFSFEIVDHYQRKYGQSGYTLSNLFAHALNMMTGFSIVPLQISSLIGVVLSLFGIVILIYVFIGWFTHGSATPGFAFLASIITIFSGAQLLALGIFGEYIARIHLKSMGIPSYSILEDTEKV